MRKIVTVCLALLLLGAHASSYRQGGLTHDANTLERGSMSNALQGCGVYCFDQPVLKPSGWNYNLTRRCVETPGKPDDGTWPSTLEEEYYFADTGRPEDPPEAKCEPDWRSVNPPRRWLLSAHSENSDSHLPCPELGPINQSFKINTPGTIRDPHSPIEFDLIRNGYDNWTAVLNTDLVTHPHPCGPGWWTWYAFMDHTGPFPGPHSTQFSFVVLYTSSVAPDDEPDERSRPWSTGAATLQASWTSWDRTAMRAVRKTYMIGVATRNNAPKGPNKHPAILQYKVNNEGLVVVVLDAEVYSAWTGQNLVFGPQPRPITINFRQILDDLTSRKWAMGNGYCDTCPPCDTCSFIDPPLSGNWDSPDAVTEAIFVSTEAYVGTRRADTVSSAMFVTNWRIDRIERQTYCFSVCG